MLIANLRADPATPESEDWIWSRCHIPHGVWIRYPKRYIGINPPIIAEQPSGNNSIKFLDFEDPDGFCGSDNEDLIRALALSKIPGKCYANE